MKREFLESLDLGEKGGKLPKAAVDAIMAENGRDIEAARQGAADWERRYDADTRSLREQLEAARYGYAVKEAVSGLRFTSESAKKSFLAELTEKKLPMQEGTLLGLEEFTEAYRKADPGAFAPEDEDRTPVATRGGGGGDPFAESSALRAAFGIPDKR